MKKSLLVTLILCLSCCASATTWYVDDNAPNDPAAGYPNQSDPLEDGTAAHPFDAIQEAIDAAADTNVVIVADGTYTGDGNRDIDFLGKPITVKSQNGPETCIIDCQGTEQDPHRAFIFHSGETHDSILEGFAITNGYAPTKEILWGDELINVSDHGGAISCVNSSSIIRNCRFYCNTAKAIQCYPDYSMGSGSGGAIACQNNADVILQSCVFEDNLSYWGGAIYMETSVGEISNCVIVGNSTGAVFANSECVINHSTFHANRGLFVFQGIINYGVSIITGYSGFSGVTGTSSIEINNSIIWDDPPVYNADGSTIDVTYSNVKHGYAGEGNISLDPGFMQSGYWDDDGDPESWWWYDDAWGAWHSLVNWYSGDYRLQYLWSWDKDTQSWVSPGYNPCVDSGNQVVYYTSHDIDGHPRPVDGNHDGQAIADMGAYEMYPGHLPIIAVNTNELSIGVRKDLVPVGQFFSIHAGNTQALEWSITNASSWLRFSQTSGTSLQNANNMIVTLDITGMDIGHYAGSFDIVSPTASNQQTINVNLTINSPLLYVPENYATIQEAINWACDGETVLIADGNYIGDGNRDIDFLGKAITVQSENGPESCIIDCQGTEEDPHRAFIFDSGETHDSVLSGITIINGFASVNRIFGEIDIYDEKSISGGAIFCKDSSPTIQNCRFQDNRAWLWKTTTTQGISNTVYAGVGGAVACYGGQVIIEDCIFQRNRALDSAGAISCINGDINISNCVLKQNIANTIITFQGLSEGLGSGGAIVCENASMILKGSVLERNITQSRGGAVMLRNSPVDISNCIFSANQSEYIAGAIYLTQSECFILNSTFCGNNACSITQGISGCIYPSVIAADSNDIIVENCILWDKFGTVGPGIATYSNIRTNEYRTEYAGLGNMSVEPEFVRMGYWDHNGTLFDWSDDIWISGDYHLKSEGWSWDSMTNEWTWDEVTSPCIDAGNPGMALGDEPVTLPDDDPHNRWGQNIRINMGAYGGTPEASMAPPGWALLCDLDNSYQVDFDDLLPMIDTWLLTGLNQPADVSRDGIVSLEDFAALAEQWLNRAVRYGVPVPGDGDDIPVPVPVDSGLVMTTLQ